MVTIYGINVPVKGLPRLVASAGAGDYFAAASSALNFAAFSGCRNES